MMRHVGPETQVLDQEFEDIIVKLKPYILNIPSSKTSKLCRLWLERLNKTDDQRSLRNDYLRELYKQLKNGCFEVPFSEPPPSTRLIPIANCHRLVSSSSCNELTETSFSPCEKPKCALPKPRSKSLRRDVPRRRNSCKTPTYQFDVHSNSSPNRLPHVENSVILSPNGNFQEQPENRNLLRSYRNKIESLNTVVQDLENENEKLKQKLASYHSALPSNKVPHLQGCIKQLMGEITKLKSRLMEVQKIKDTLDTHHRAIVLKYKQKLTEQYEKMKSKLKSAHIENQELTIQIALFEKKLQDTSYQNNDWERQIDSMRIEHKRVLMEKEEELRIKMNQIQQKDLELSEKLREIENLSQRIIELEHALKSKLQDEENPRTAEQFKAVMDDLSLVIQRMDSTAREQNKSHQHDIDVLKKKLEKLTPKITTRLGKKKKKALIELLMQIQEITHLDKNFKFPGKDELIEKQYRELLNVVETLANDKRSEYFNKLDFLENQLRRLQN